MSEANQQYKEKWYVKNWFLITLLIITSWLPPAAIILIPFVILKGSQAKKYIGQSEKEMTLLQEKALRQMLQKLIKR